MNVLIQNLPARFFIDLAIGAQSTDDICKLYNLKREDLEPHWEDPQFIHRLAVAQQAVEDDGRAFRARCKTVVHDSIPRMQQIIHDPDTPAATQLSAFQALVRYSGMEPEKQTANNIAQGPSLSLTIIAPGGEQQRIGISAHNPALPDPDAIDLDPDDFESIPLASAEESALFSI